MSDPARNILDIRQILGLLPHRYPFLLVDRVTEYVPGEYIKAYKNVTMNEPFFEGHFPGVPVMPGVLIMEALAQAGGILVVKSTDPPVEDKLFLFPGIESVRFRKPVYPGDRLELHCRLLRHKLKLWKMEGFAYVDGKLAAEAVMTAAVTNREDM
jgi:3-hydroxyacyl-[acyl-carrier-protein] dehydratase